MCLRSGCRCIMMAGSAAEASVATILKESDIVLGHKCCN